MSRSLADRLGVRMLALVSVLLISAVVASDRLIERNLQSEFDRALHARAQSLAQLLEQDEDGVDFDFAEETMPEFSTGHEPEYFELWLQGWRESVRAAALQDHHLSRENGRSTAPRYSDVRLPDGRRGRQVQLDFQPFLDPKENLDPTAVVRPAATLAVARSRLAFDGTVARLRWGLALIAGVAIVASGVLVRATVMHGLRPLTGIALRLSEIHPNNLRTRLDPPDDARELEPVVRQFNALLETLEAAFSREQIFAVAAAHELRTPLSEIRSLAEIGARCAEEPALAREYFSDILAATRQLEALTVHLLTLAQHDAGRDLAADCAPSRLDLVQAARQLWDAMSQDHGRAASALDYYGPPRAVVCADTRALSLILRNIFENARCHAPAGSTVRLEITRDGAAVDLSLANPVGTLTDEDVARVFDRFWRKDGARGADGHHGLGLALVYAAGVREGLRVSAMIDGNRHFVLRLAGFRSADDPSG